MTEIGWHTVSDMAVLARDSPEARFETKYLIQPDVRTALLADLTKLMERDGHGDAESSGYRVSSLYFDTPSNGHYYEKIDGIGLRTRFRIRQYGTASSERRLEMKQRLFYQNQKSRVPLDALSYQQIVAGRFPWELSGDEVAQAFSAARARQGLRPCAVVEYQRLALLGRADRSVRVTLDSELRVWRAASFERRLCHAAPVFGQGVSILELKWRDGFPIWLQTIVRKYSLQNLALSKYVLALDALMEQGLIPRV